MGTGAGTPAKDLSTGIPGAGEIRPGTHFCAFYSGPTQRDQLLVPYMREGRRRGDECVRLVDELDPTTTQMRELSGGQMMSAIAATLMSAADGALPLLRVAVEMSWVPQDRGEKGLSVFESAVAQVLAERPAVFLCLYDLQRFGMGTLFNALRIHSKVLLDGVVLDNPQILEPYVGPVPEAARRAPMTRVQGGRADGGDRWLLLSGAEVRVAGLVATGMSNRAMAAELVVSPHTVDAHLKHIYVKLGIHSRVELTLAQLQHGPPAA